ncbi:hypothetical protein INT45_008472 [Circinella minor]|uniref:Uncharacterized protein n=1 Tax=Circinella minor TaxID=1195481 RepID=A0A8H7VSK1_9FUNG|nr:hypothetical protein INT45_008472 [Circinella minor]
MLVVSLLDREELKRDSKQMGNIAARKAAVWNDFYRTEKGEYERKAQAYNVMEGKVASSRPGTNGPLSFQIALFKTFTCFVKNAVWEAFALLHQQLKGKQFE